jgi:hypothetical protein
MVVDGPVCVVRVAGRLREAGDRGLDRRSFDGWKRAGSMR